MFRCKNVKFLDLNHKNYNFIPMIFAVIIYLKPDIEAMSEVLLDSSNKRNKRESFLSS